MAPSSSRYTSVAIALHWAIALGIIFMIWLGWNMDDNEARFQLHKSIGITILILTVARIIWRVMNPPPPLPEDMRALEKTASHLVHVGFYALMLAMPLTGWLVVSTHTSFDIPIVLYGLVSWPDIPGVGFLENETAHEVLEFIHSKLAWVTIILLGLHVAGAIKHEIGGEDGVIKRMIPGLFGQPGPPQAPPRGALMAFGAAGALFALIALVPLVGKPSQAAPDVSADAGITGNWTVDHDASTIAFSGIHDGNPYSGTFASWSAAIDFDPATPERGRALVSVATDSARAGQKLYTDSLKSAEWLNPQAFPQATVEISNISATAAGYTSTARLTLKDNTVEVPFDFTLEITGNTAVMTGAATLQRTPLDLGQTSDPSGDWVAEAVNVDVTVTAERAPAAQ